MSGFADFPGSEVRARLDHPVIDCDAHVVEGAFRDRRLPQRRGRPERGRALPQMPELSPVQSAEPRLLVGRSVGTAYERSRDVDAAETLSRAHGRHRLRFRPPLYDRRYPGLVLSRR